MSQVAAPTAPLPVSNLSAASAAAARPLTAQPCAPAAAAAAPIPATAPPHDLRFVMALPPMLDIEQIVLEFFDRHVSETIHGISSSDTFLRRSLIRSVLRKHLAHEIGTIGFTVTDINEIYEYALGCLKKIGITQFAPLAPDLPFQPIFKNPTQAAPTLPTTGPR